MQLYSWEVTKWRGSSQIVSFNCPLLTQVSFCWNTPFDEVTVPNKFGSFPPSVSVHYGWCMQAPSTHLNPWPQLLLLDVAPKSLSQYHSIIRPALLQLSVPVPFHASVVPLVPWSRPPSVSWHHFASCGSGCATTGGVVEYKLCAPRLAVSYVVGKLSVATGVALAKACLLSLDHIASPVIAGETAATTTIKAKTPSNPYVKRLSFTLR